MGPLGLKNGQFRTFGAIFHKKTKKTVIFWIWGRKTANFPFFWPFFEKNTKKRPIFHFLRGNRGIFGFFDLSGLKNDQFDPIATKNCQIGGCSTPPLFRRGVELLLEPIFQWKDLGKPKNFAHFALFNEPFCTFQWDFGLSFSYQNFFLRCSNGRLDKNRKKGVKTVQNSKIELLGQFFKIVLAETIGKRYYENRGGPSVLPGTPHFLGGQGGKNCPKTSGFPVLFIEILALEGG